MTTMMQPSLDRRRFLKIAGLVAASATLAACGPRPGGARRQAAIADEIDPHTFAVLNRLTYGPTPTELARVSTIGLAGWIEEQLADDVSADEALAPRLRNLTTLDLSADALFAVSDRLFDDEDRELAPRELRQATLLRRVYSRRQLYERVVEFWSDHFNITVDKDQCYVLKTVDDRDVIRPHALGRFRDLLWASAHSPAMLVYLDNQVSNAEHPNENYARELLELHTLGVEGGYSQADVMALARCLTGWSVKERFWRGDFEYKPELHDNGPKVVLGQMIAPAGQAEAEGVLERLAVHTSTARHVTGKLAQYLLGPAATPHLVTRAVSAFERTQGDIRAVVRVLLLDGLLRAPIQPKFKRPGDLVISALRQMQAETEAGPELLGLLARMGHLPFAWPTPDGYPDRDEAWVRSLMPRWQFALALAAGRLEDEPSGLVTQLRNTPRIEVGRWLEARDVRDGQTARTALCQTLFGHVPADVDAWPGDLLEPWDATAQQALLAGLLASPAFQWR